MFTLHAYILRELLKSFGLTVLALTSLFTMGGGLYNMLKFEGITAGDLFVVLPMLIPVAITVTMPVAAIFAATITYGRLAADNELVACRAAGINIHRIFLSAILLSVFVALTTALSVNIMIPHFMDNMVRFAKGNVRQFAYNRLLQQGYVNRHEQGRDGYTLTAQAVKNVPAAELISKGFDPPGDGVSYMWVERPTFLNTDKDGELKRFLFAEGGLCQFDARGDEIKFTLYVINARNYDVGKRTVQIGRQKIGPYSQKIPFTPKASVVALDKLYEWRSKPWLNARVRRKMEPFLRRLHAAVFLSEVGARLVRGQTLTFDTPSGDRYDLRAKSCDARNHELVLENVLVIKHHAHSAGTTASATTRYEAPRGKLRAGSYNERVVIELIVSGTAGAAVREIRAGPAGEGHPRELETRRIAGLQTPAFVEEAMLKFTPAAILAGSVDMPPDPALQEQCRELREFSEKHRRKVDGVIHFRLGFATSALVTILMGAALGVMFRGSRALAAFGLACIPFLIVALLIMVGRQLTDNAPTHHIGPFVIWGGLVLVAIADSVILRVGVKR